jgi:hypothetical protein
MEIINWDMSKSFCTENKLSDSILSSADWVARASRIFGAWYIGM